MGQFLQSAVHLQFFKQFIDGRLDILNTGEEPDDLFEDEILKCETTAGRSKSYQQLVGNLKKGGGALILNMKSKANMRAKGLAKSGWKNLLMHKANNEAHSLQRGGSVSHRRAQSDCLQNRLPITPHFGMSRPRRPVHKHRPPRDQDNMKDTEDTWDGAVSGPAVEPDAELQEDEEDGEGTLLSDPEEMDLLGEIFDTLSSRSSHERGLLYGTRSLDLFGPDSHDYITKFGPVNPSQESLCLSISGSGSLHSWNPDSDWPYLDPSVPEEEGSECLLATCEMEEKDGGQREDEEKQEEVKVAINGNQGQEKENRHTFEEVRFEEMRVSLGAEPEEETSEKREDEGLKAKREDERNQSDELAEGQETQRETKEMQKVVASEEEGNENQEEKEVTRSFNELRKLNNHYPNMVEERQGQQETDIPDSTVCPGPQSPTADPKPPAVQEQRSEEAVKKEERGSGQMPSPPKVQSTVARFQSQASSQSFQVKSRIKGLAEPGRPCNALWSTEKTQTHRPCDSNISEENNCSGAHEGKDPTPIKVSELKKRFEA